MVTAYVDVTLKRVPIGLAASLVDLANKLAEGQKPGGIVMSPTQIGDNITLEPAEKELVRMGRFIPAIKALRERTYCTLLDGKKAVDEYRGELLKQEQE